MTEKLHKIVMSSTCNTNKHTRYEVQIALSHPHHVQRNLQATGDTHQQYTKQFVDTHLARLHMEICRFKPIGCCRVPTRNSNEVFRSLPLQLHLNSGYHLHVYGSIKASIEAIFNPTKWWERTFYFHLVNGFDIPGYSSYLSTNGNLV